MMDRERFEQTNYKMEYEQYLKCYCPNCKKENCVHRETHRRLPRIDGGLELCPNLRVGK